MPARHKIQEDAPARTLYEPAAHVLHPVALVVPGLVTVPVYPGAQTVHAETDVLPGDKSVVVTPVGQSMHKIEPADEYFPAGHVKQVEEEVASIDVE